MCERVNAWLAPYGITTQYMHGTNREATLERAVLVKALALDDRLHLLLLELTLRTAKQQETTAAELQKLTSQLQEMLTAPAQQVWQAPSSSLHMCSVQGC